MKEQKRKRPPGRPQLMTKARAQTICDAVSVGVPLEYAAALAKMDDATVNRAKRRSKEFCTAVKEAEGKLIHGLLSIILIAAKNGQRTAGAWLLERRWPHLFAKIERQELSGPGGTPLPTGFHDPAYIAAVREALGFTASNMEKKSLPPGDIVVQAVPVNGDKSQT